jgi:hypothetical protein
MLLVRYVLFLALLLAPVISQGLPGESIVLAPNTGNYTITYFGIDPETGKRDALHSATFEPATKIKPEVVSKMKLKEGWIVAYGYKLHSHADSAQPVIKLQFDLSAGLVTTDILEQEGTIIPYNSTVPNWGEASYPMNLPRGWNGRAARLASGLLRVSMSSLRNSLPAGEALNGYEFYSRDIPSIGIAKVQGDSSVLTLPDEGPVGEVGDQLEQLVQNDFVSRPAAIPAIAVPTPFDASILLDRIRTEMNGWPAKQQLDPAYAAQLDRHMVAAADAYRLSNAKAGKEHIKTIRKMLAKEHHNLDHDNEGDEDTEEHKAATRFTIDRLAARVLDFDLRYVLKRMEPVEDEAHH